LAPSDSKRLILVPTQLELQHASDLNTWQCEKTLVHICGFGVIASAAKTAALLAQIQPTEVLLIGIAGALSRKLKIGQAYQFSTVACYGVGVGSRENFQTGGEIGWSHWPDDPYIGDCIDLRTSVSVSRPVEQLLTTCAASHSIGEAALHKAKFPIAEAEDMEGFAVAAACQLAGIPLRIIRGISNLAGNRESRDWRIGHAMRAAVELTGQILDL
jgi:futalosine hydrolase